MLRGHKSPGEIVAEIKMSRMSHSGAFLILEGTDDVRFWEARRHATCQLVDGEGKLNVIGAVQRLKATRFRGALGIADDDGDLLIGARVESDNLLYTDAHDLECLLCRSSAFEKVLAEHGDAAKIRQFEIAGVDVRTALLERALIFGRVRLAARLSRPAIDLEMRVQQFVDRNTWAVDDEGVIRRATGEAPADTHAITSRLAHLPEADPWYVARGHDLIEILRIGLQRVLGNLPAHIGVKDIARLLRAGVTPEDLRQTGLWTNLRAWQAANRPYAVLAD